MFLRSLSTTPNSSPDGDGSGGNPAPTTTTENQTFSADFVRELRAEARSWRLKFNETEKQANEFKSAAEKAAADLAGYSKKAEADLAARVGEVQSAAAQRLIRAEVKAGAISAGIGHLDFVKLLDTSAIKVDEDGEVAIPDNFWTEAKAKFGHLFAQTGADKGTTTQTSATPPKPQDTSKGKNVKDMSPEERKVAFTRIAKGLEP